MNTLLIFSVCITAAIAADPNLFAPATDAGARAASGGGPMDLGFELRFLDLKKHPLAVCNDGSPGAYYVRKACPDRWLVHQQGGFWCWDDWPVEILRNTFSD